ncbi:recombinase family protein [Kitasatospora nipponensis]|uniref:recombinase family protein n=1 Tax=Kitasatospora nipponensis TaxID=258049 RepID=UPI0031DE7B2D
MRAADQTAVDRQESTCRELAHGVGVRIGARQVYVDNRAAAWLEERSRPAWTAMLHAARLAEFGRLFLYAPDRLRVLGRSFCELLDVADEFGILLHGIGDGRDLNDPAERQLIREEIARAGRSVSSASLAARSAHAKAAADGKPHGGGRRPYGYEATTYRLIEAEAATVREIYRRFLDGWSLRAIALDLNGRSVPTVGGGKWSTSGIARILDAPRYAGLCVFRGEVARTEDGTGYLMGAWEPCVSIAQ